MGSSTNSSTSPSAQMGTSPAGISTSYAASTWVRGRNRGRGRGRGRGRVRVSGHLDVVRREHLGRDDAEITRRSRGDAGRCGEMRGEVHTRGRPTDPSPWWGAAHTYYYLSESYVLDVVPLTPHLGGEPLARRVAVGDETGGPHRRHDLGRQRGLLLTLLAHLLRGRVRVGG